jgi:hypothetical protein
MSPAKPPAGTTHGAYSGDQIRAKARAHKRRFLRQIGKKASDLDGVTLELLNMWARGAARLDLWDAGADVVGKDYWVAYNGTRRCLEALERRLIALKDEWAKADLDAILEEYR